MAYYFAYGSNLDYTRMFNRCPSSDVIGRCELEGFQLAFMENNSHRIVANLIEQGDGIVYGVLYEVSEEDLEALDMYEGHPYVYQRRMVKIACRGNEYNAVTYIMNRKAKIHDKDYQVLFIRKFGIPKGEYFSHIQRGYEMFGLPQSYLMEQYKFSRDLGIKELKNYI